MSYTVSCTENFGHDSWVEGKHETYEQALAKCKANIKQSVSEFVRPCASSEDIYRSWAAWGEVSSVYPEPGSKIFLPTEYAKEAAKELQSPYLTQRYDEALQFAAELHREHARKGANVPYLSHLLAVSSLVLEYGGDEDQAIAALLHDAIEDQAEKAGGRQALGTAIKERFGDKVLNIVQACSDCDGDGPKPAWRERKEAYIAHLASGTMSTPDGEASVPDDTYLVSYCDKLHNARCIVSDMRKLGDKLFDRFTGGKAGTLWYYRALADLYRARRPADLIDELELTVTEMERLAGVEPASSSSSVDCARAAVDKLSTDLYPEVLKVSCVEWQPQIVSIRGEVTFMQVELDSLGFRVDYSRDISKWMDDFPSASEDFLAAELNAYADARRLDLGLITKEEMAELLESCKTAYYPWLSQMNDIIVRLQAEATGAHDRPLMLLMACGTEIVNAHKRLMDSVDGLIAAIENGAQSD